MLIPFLVSKIHQAAVTGVEPSHSTCIAVDSDLMQEAGLREYQKVKVYNEKNGDRFTTHIMAAGAGSGEVVLKGALSALANTGDKLVVSAFAYLDERELNSLNSVILLMSEGNKIDRIITGKL